MRTSGPGQSALLLLAMKVFAGGPQDIADAKNALLAAGEMLDIELMKRVAKRFGRSTLAGLEELLAEGDR